MKKQSFIRLKVLGVGCGIAFVSALLAGWISDDSFDVRFWVIFAVVFILGALMIGNAIYKVPDSEIDATYYNKDNDD